MAAPGGKHPRGGWWTSDLLLPTEHTAGILGRVPDEVKVGVLHFLPPDERFDGAAALGTDPLHHSVLAGATVDLTNQRILGSIGEGSLAHVKVVKLDASQLTDISLINRLRVGHVPALVVQHGPSDRPPRISNLDLGGVRSLTVYARTPDAACELARGVILLAPNVRSVRLRSRAVPRGQSERLSVCSNWFWTSIRKSDVERVSVECKGVVFDHARVGTLAKVKHLTFQGLGGIGAVIGLVPEASTPALETVTIRDGMLTFPQAVEVATALRPRARLILDDTAVGEDDEGASDAQRLEFDTMVSQGAIELRDTFVDEDGP